MKDFYFAQLVILILGGSGAFYISGKHAVVGFSAGLILVTLNVRILEYVWRRILEKKPVAWTLFIIVLKYTLLGYVLYLVATKGLLPVGWFSLGLATLILAIFGIRKSAL